MIGLVSRLLATAWRSPPGRGSRSRDDPLGGAIAALARLASIVLDRSSARLGPPADDERARDPRAAVVDALGSRATGMAGRLAPSRRDTGSRLTMTASPREALASLASRSLPPKVPAVTRALAAPLTAAGRPLLGLAGHLIAVPPIPRERATPPPSTEDTDTEDEREERSLVTLITTRARAYVHRFARGLTAGQMAGHITVTASDRSPRRAPDRRSTSSDVCRTRTRPPDPLEGRPADADDRDGRHASSVASPTRGEDEV